MKITNIFFVLFLIVFSVLSSCKSDPSKSGKTNIEYLNTDFKPDEFYPARQVELQIKSSGSTMYGFAYIANGAGPHPTVVLLHGLPGNERNLDIAQNMRRAGFNVIYFNYRGTWGSKGVFKFQNAIDDAGAVVDYLTDSLNRVTLKVDTGKITYVGHSMGAGLALIAGLKDPRIKGVFAVSVFNPFTLLQGENAAGNLIGLKEYLLTLGMLNCDPNKFLNDILNDIDLYNIEKMIENSKKPVMVVDEHMNNSSFTNYNKSKTFEYKIWNTDHAFSNRRIALTKEIVNWMNNNIVQKTPAMKKQ
jgi:cephalosporin-C deacetylase-like acetyl esterase